MSDYIKNYLNRTRKSKQLFEKLNKFIIGGTSHNIRYYPPYPIFIERCAGSKIYDVDGNEYIDLWMGHYSHILGHSPDILKEVNRGTIEIGYHSGCVNPYELKLAEKIAKLIPSVETLRFCTSGTEATTYAIRLSRAYTGKEMVLKIAGGWHGAGTELTKAIKYPYRKKITSGIPKEISMKTDYIYFNDINQSYKTIKKYEKNIACIILEPVIGEGGFLPAERKYLEFLREVSLKLKSVLIFDEIITGFRITINGAQGFFNILPDLTTLGKIAGGGFNIGVIGGKREILELASPTYNGKNKVLIGGGTFSETPYSMRAGFAVLDFLEKNKNEIYPELNKKGEYLRNSINSFIKKNNINALITGIGSLYMIHFPNKKIKKIKGPQDIASKTDILKREHEFKVRMLNEGIHVMHGGGALSTAHTQEDIDKIIEKTCKVLKEMSLQID